MKMLTGAMNRQFTDQFTRDGDGWLFRKGQCGAAIPISAVERDNFIVDYVRTLRRSWWWMIAAIVAANLVVLRVAIIVHVLPGSVFFRLVMGALTLAVVVAYTVVVTRAAAAPARALAQRAAVAPPLDVVEFRRSVRRAQSWSSFAAAPVSIGFLWFVAGPRVNLFDGWNAAWVLGTVAYVLFVGYHAWQKWLSGRDAIAA